MERQAREDTAPEMAVRRELFRRGLRYRVHMPIVPGTGRRRVDVVFPRARVAVLVDGCFWHGCPKHGRRPSKANSAYWAEKVEQNVDRDRDTDARLVSAGWTVVRVWEHEDVNEAADRVERAVRAAGTALDGQR
jgi:DNA mismatch endonuclease (patch repair protein)